MKACEALMHPWLKIAKFPNPYKMYSINYIGHKNSTMSFDNNFIEIKASSNKNRKLGIVKITYKVRIIGNKRNRNIKK